MNIMARLGQIVKTLNIGIGTATDFLKANNYELEANPNVKLTKEQEDKLLHEFATPEILEQIKNKSKKREEVKDTPAETPVVAAEPIKKPEPKSEPEEDKPTFKIVDKIDLDSLNKPKSKEVKPDTVAKPESTEPVAKQEDTAPAAMPKQEPKMESEQKTQPEVKPEVVQPKTVETPAKPIVTEPTSEEKKSELKPKSENRPEVKNTPKQTVKSEPKPEVKVTDSKPEPKSEPTPEAKSEEAAKPAKPANAEPEIFSLGKKEIVNTIKIIDKIDLSAINNSTRPQKKTKEEKRKERMAKERQAQDSRRNANKQAGNNNNNNNAQGAGGQQPQNQQKPANGDQATANKKKRKRIGGERIDVSKAIQGGGGAPRPNGQNNNNNNNNNRSQGGGPGQGRRNKNNPRQIHTPQVSEEDVAKQVKETLARLTEGRKGGVKKGAKYRKDKRDAVAQRMQAELDAEQAESKILKLTEFVTANELAVMMNLSVTQIIQTCFNLGLFVSINQRLDAETINIVADEFGFKTEYVSAEVIDAITEEEDSEEDLLPRAPIVTVMGHVDHGKTSLLDYVRKANVIAGEAGGITQHIGAYNVELEDGKHITFLDTPGHEAFTAMRARGAKVTDIAIIIVAADDNIMPQTIEAINHASAAGVPIVFAINKIDKSGANPDKIKESLAAMNYMVEEWGGKYQSHDISAKQGIGVNELLEKVLLEAELLDLKANPNRKASGSIIESSLDKGRGYVSTVLVSNGTLRVGDVVLAGTAYGRVKAMFNERNQRIKEAGPAEPVIVLGLNGAPQAGDNFNVFAEDHEAREIANKREQLAREQGLRTSKHLTLDEIGRRIALGNFQEVNVIVKGDVDGSIEALSDSLLKLSTEEIQVNVIHKAVGQISESDVMLAAASNAIVIGFQVRPSMAARKLAEKEEIDIRLYSIIYDAIEELKSAMEGMLAPEIKEEITATLEIRETFKITKVGTIAGCMVKEGKVKRNNKVRLIRDGIVVYTGELASLKRMKDDVKEVNFGYECGLNIANYNDIRIGDLIEAYEEVEVKKTL